MDEQSLRRILTTFADSPADVSLARGRILVQVHEELIEADVRRRDGSLFVEEAGLEYSAQRWIVNRIARLPLLADRILTYTEPEPHFVDPSCHLLDELERTGSESPSHSSSALSSLKELVGRDRVGTAGVVYLTSDAGEGKSTVINTLALAQARQHKKKESTWLLLPIPLGGRPFLRLDDVVAGALLNRLRFPMFFESFVELVKLGAIVPALDGFEEMFVESAAGDAASALGNLMGLLQSSGTVLVAARQAYFDYKNLDTQARLYDALSEQSVSFSSVRLDRWDRRQFVTYSDMRGLSDSGALYDRVEEKLGAEHPLLTRAVLVARLIDLRLESESTEGVLSQIEGGTTDYFGQLVKPILARETEKWVDKSGIPLMPLLAQDEHMQLLETLAMEMWIAERAIVAADVLDYAAELFCETKRKSAAVTRQVVERIKQHALLVNKGGDRGAFQFDHEEFYYYFLGRAVARRLGARDDNETKSAMRRTALPQLALEAAAVALRSDPLALKRAVESVNRVSATEPAASHVRENGGAIIVRGLDGSPGSGIIVEGLVFLRGCLTDRRLNGLVFRRCEFGEFVVSDGTLTDVAFEDCRFDVLFLRSTQALGSVTLTRCTARAVAPPGSSVPTYDPTTIARLLPLAWTEKLEGEPPVPPLVMDENLKLTERVVRRFLRTTELNENVMRQAAGSHANTFIRDLLPELRDHGVLREVPYLGSGQQMRFRLGRPLREVSEALKRSEGSFQRFLDLMGED